MRLQVHDRLVLLSLLPGEGNFLLLTLVQELRRKLHVTAKEQDTIGFNPTTLQWSAEKEALLPPFEMEFAQVERDVIVTVLEKLNRAEKLHVDHLRCYRIFVLGESLDES